MIFDPNTLHCNSRKFENCQNLRPKSVFSSQKPFRCQILGQDIHFLRFYKGLCPFSKMAACPLIQDGGINVERVYSAECTRFQTNGGKRHQNVGQHVGPVCSRPNLLQLLQQSELMMKPNQRKNLKHR